MTRRAVIGLAVIGLATGWIASAAAQLKPIKTQKAKGVTVTLLSETCEWKPGRNTFVLEFTTPDQKPADVGKVTLTASMPMPGMAPMISGATPQPEGPGRYRGTITFPDSGDRQVTVTWDGGAGRGSTRFSVPVC